MPPIEYVDAKTSELTGVALNWAMAQVKGYKVVFSDEIVGPDEWIVMGREDMYLTLDPDMFHVWTPSNDWGQCGPLIEEYRVSLIYAFERYEALIGMTHSECFESPLVAACKCIAVSVLGETISVPKDLLTHVLYGEPEEESHASD